VSARRVRSARRRQPVFSRIRSRCEPTVRTLMNSLAAIWASVMPWATRVTSSRSRGLSLAGPGGAGGCGPWALSVRAYSAAAAMFIAAPRSSAARARASPSVCLAWSSGSARRPSSEGGSMNPCFRASAARAAHIVMASAGRPVAAHRCPQQSRPLNVSAWLPIRPATLSDCRRCSVASSIRPVSRSRNAIRTNSLARFRRSPASRARASPPAQLRSAAPRSPARVSAPVKMLLPDRAIQPGMSAGSSCAC